MRAGRAVRSAAPVGRARAEVDDVLDAQARPDHAMVFHGAGDHGGECAEVDAAPGAEFFAVPRTEGVGHAQPGQRRRNLKAVERGDLAEGRLAVDRELSEERRLAAFTASGGRGANMRSSRRARSAATRK